MENSAKRKISVTMPDLLIDEVDTLATSLNRSRSELIVTVLKQYLKERKNVELKEQLKKGYLEMGNININIAENSLLSDECAYEIYEKYLEST